MTLGDYCTAKRKDGNIVITIPEEAMLDYFLRSDPDFPLIENREAFFEFLTAQLLQTEAPKRDDIYTTVVEQLIRRTAVKYEEEGAS